MQRWPVSNHQVLCLAAEKPGISKSSLVRVRQQTPSGILSGCDQGLQLLEVSDPTSALKTAVWSTLNVCISGNLLPLMAGISTDTSSVKTLLNCSFRMLVLVLGSLCAIPSYLSGDLPLLPHFCLCSMYRASWSFCHLSRCRWRSPFYITIEIPFEAACTAGDHCLGKNV